MRKDIIIIDDDRDLCTLLQESLLQENICADISCNGFDGIKSVKDVCKEGEEKIHTASQVNLTEPFKEMRNEKINILG